MMQFIDIPRQYAQYKKEIDAAVAEVLSSCQFILGPQVGRLEEQLSQFVGCSHTLGVSSGTDALLIALMALDIGPGDEVITTPFTWISTAEVIALLGARPVFVDIDPATYNIDVDKISAAITPKTKALMPVSLFGQIPDMERLNAFGLPVIEDGAQSFGATQQGKHSGNLSLIGTTSFFPAKPFGCYGDGGAIFTSDAALDKKMRAIHNHGCHTRYHHTCLGINGRLDTLQAAIMLAKLPHYSKEIALRNEVAARYNKVLEGPVTAPGNTHVWAQYTIRLSAREKVVAALKEKGIPTGVYYPKCLHEQPVFADLGYQRGDFPIAEKAADEVLSLPMHPWLAPEEQHMITQQLEVCLGTAHV